MSIIRILFLLISFALCTFTLKAQEPSTPSIKALHAYATKNGISPKEYIFKLFEQSDIIVLGERDHRDTVQYDFYLDVLADPRFAERIGYIYTEVGSNNMTEEVNQLLQGTYPTEKDFIESLYIYYRKSETFYPLWEKYNRIKFLKGLYDINRTSSNKIRLGLTDCKFSWEEIRTTEDYKKFWHSPEVNDRDSLMCTHFAEMYARQTPLNGKRKALVITSQPHAINHSQFFRRWNRDYRTQGWWMKQTFGEERVKIVLMNWFDYRLFDGQNFPMTGKGTWDAAFELMNCRPFGIDLQNNPYGETAFNGVAGGSALFIKKRKWQDVADGLIYDAPLYNHVAAWGIDGLIPKEFEPEIKRRTELYWKVANPKEETIPFDVFINEYNIFHTYPAAFKSKEDAKQLIQKVLSEQQDKN